MRGILGHTPELAAAPHRARAHSRVEPRRGRAHASRAPADRPRSSPTSSGTTTAPPSPPRAGRRVEIDAAPELADSVFVEDTVVHVRRPRGDHEPGRRVAPARDRGRRAHGARDRRAHRRRASSSPGTLEGGDVLKVGPVVYVGASSRTNAEGIRQLRELLTPHGYPVVAVPVTKALHLKSAATALPDGTIIGDPALRRRARACSRRFLPVPEPEGVAVVELAPDVAADVGVGAADRRDARRRSATGSSRSTSASSRSSRAASRACRCGCADHRARRRTRVPSCSSTHAVGAAHERRVVGRDDGGDAAGVHELADEVHHGRRGAAVELAGRLVGEQHLRARGERAGDADALLLAARELVGALRGVRRRARRARATRRPARRARPAACAASRSGTSTFSAADSTGMSPNDWNT